MASARQLIPNNLVATGNASLYFMEIDQKLTKALEENGYIERSYFEAPTGFVLVTRLEQIEPDGRSKTPPARWSRDMPGSSSRFSLAGYLRALFTAPVGYYRIIAFVVGSTSFHEDKTTVTSGEAISWLTRGGSSLPDSIAMLPYKSNMSCTALIYEFERQEQIKDAQFVSPGRLDAHTHFVKSGLWRALGGDNKP